MSQVTDFTIPSSDLDMAELKAKLEAAFAALGSANRGGTAPSNPFSGMAWLDTSVSNLEILKVYLAAGWTSLATINTTTGVVSFNLNAASIVESLIADAAVTTSKLAANSVTTSKIANLTFQASHDGGATWNDLYDSNNTEVSFAARASRYIALDQPELFAAIPMIKIRSGSSSAPITQSADRSISLILRSI